MSKAVNSKWKKIFPDTIGNQNRPATGVDDTQPFETGAFPQYIANDPVRYDLQNAAMSQSMSNDARLKEMVDARGKELDDHKVDPGAHKTGIAGNAATATKVVTTAATGASANIAEASMGGSNSARIRVSGAENAGELALETADDGSEPIVARQYTGIYTTPVRTAKILDESGNTSFPGTVVAPKFTGALNGNAATATKLQTPRTLSLTGKAAGSTTFDGSANAAINVTSVNADTASKLSTARKINITGNATGAAAFDGTSDVSINVSVNESKHAAADRTTADANGRAFTDTNAYMHISALANNTDFNNVKTTGIYYCTGNTYSNRPHDAWGILTVYSIGTVKQEYRPDNAAVYYTREYDNTEWKAWSKVNAANADTATKLATPRTISLTGNASGSANFDGSGNVSINTTVNESKHAVNADNATNASRASNATKVDCGEDQGSFIINKPGYNDYSPTVGGPYANVTIDSWFGVSFTSQCGGTVPKGKTAVGIDCRNGIVRANSFEGTLNGNASSATHASSADSATNADKVDGIHAASLFYHKGIWDANNWATIGTYQVNNNPPISGAYGWGQVISSSTTDGRFQLYASDGYGGNGRLYYRTGWDGNKNSWNTILDSENYNSFAPTKTGGGASGTWGINISGNAASATNADTVDGYHASDLLRTLGGNRTPVITDIFDRAGTIDMSTMSTADKATHKANINKAPNMVQNLWNDACGIYAYGGDNDIAGEYNRGTLKLTQSYKNFDKLMIIFTDDKADWELVRMFDVYEFNYYMTSLHSFTLLENNLFWYVYGLTKQGTDASFKPSTETVLSCRYQNCGIIGIYGIKY